MDSSLEAMTIKAHLDQALLDLNQSNAKLNLDAADMFLLDCKAMLERNFNMPQNKFTLRMSNIGKPLRSLYLDYLYGEAAMNPQLKLMLMNGELIESMIMLLLHHSGLKIDSAQKQVSLKLDKFEIKGTLDLIIFNKVWDVKSASDYAFRHKFASFEAMQSDDPFGYIGQGIGYAEAENIEFGGWIAYNKAKGEYDVIPASYGNDLKKKVLDDFLYKCRFFENPDAFPKPECNCVIEETFYKKPTGYKCLNKSGEFCNHKFKCHPNLEYAETKCGNAENKTWKYYLT